MALQATPGGGDFNKNMEFILQYLSRLGLMKKQEAMQGRLIGQRMAGYSQLEEERQANRMAQIQETFMNNIARDPVVERNVALIFQKRQKGEEVPLELLKKTKKSIKERSMLALYTHSGKVLPPGAEDWFDDLSEQALVNITGQGATTARAKMVREIEEAKLGVRGYEADTARIREARLFQDMTKEDVEKQRTRWIDMVKDTVNFLETEGVKGESIGADIRSLFSSGKVTDPLSSANRGKAFTYLAEIWTKLIQRKKLTPGDIKFLINVRNARSIEAPIAEGGFGGVPEPGLGGESQAQVQQGMIEQIASDIQAKSGVDRQTALEYAKEFYSGKIK